MRARAQALRMSERADLRMAITQKVAGLIASQAEDGYLGPFRKEERLLGHWDLWGHYHALLAHAADFVIHAIDHGGMHRHLVRLEFLLGGGEAVPRPPLADFAGADFADAVFAPVNTVEVGAGAHLFSRGDANLNAGRSTALNAVIAVNPYALAEAEALEQRATAAGDVSAAIGGSATCA